MITQSRTPSGASAAGVVLHGIRDHRRAADAEQAAVLGGVLAWCELHVTDDPALGATWGDVPVHLGGEGCPWVREFTVTELALALRMSPAGARSLVSDVLELAFRLPRLWARVEAGEVPAWRARRVAQQTQPLSMEAASFVDAQVAEFAARLGVAAVERLVEEAVGRFMPDLAREQRARAADGRRFGIDHEQVSFDGTSRVPGVLDLADALDLEAAIAHVASQLRDLGNDLGLDQRRALAAGEIARAQLDLGLSRVEAPDDEAEADTGTKKPLDSRVAVATKGRRRIGITGADRRVVLYAHLSADALRAARGGVDVRDHVVRLEGHGGRLLTLETLRDWLSISGDVRVRIRPVLDLNAKLVSNRRFPTDLQQEQLALRDVTCAAPHCNRRAMRLDADHIDPWVDPGTATTSRNCVDITTERRPSVIGPTSRCSQACSCGSRRTD